MIAETVRLHGTEMPVWPPGQQVKLLPPPDMGIVNFADRGEYHPALTAAILKMEKDPRLHDPRVAGGCGAKVRNPHQWGIPEADLIHARAMTLAAKAFGVDSVVVDNCWANVYRKGDYCMPHSHLRATASLIYMLEPGEMAADDDPGGRLFFCDPRIPACCDHEDGRVTRLYMPSMEAGSLILFPALFIHAVNPYGSERPRITMSWNVSLNRLPGDPADGWKR